MDIRKLIKNAVFLLLIVFISIQATWAADLKSAKAQGYIGEKPDGYIGLVKSDAPSDVVALVKSTNQKRKTKYQGIAAKQKISISEVGKIVGKKFISKTASGNYVMQNGRWVKK